MTDSKSYPHYENAASTFSAYVGFVGCSGITRNLSHRISRSISIILTFSLTGDGRTAEANLYSRCSNLRMGQINCLTQNPVPVDHALSTNELQECIVGQRMIRSHLLQ